MQRLGRYQLLGEIARGGMGAVYRGLDPTTGREVALKVLLVGRQASPEQRSRFLREARALARLRHAHVVTVHAVLEHDTQPFIVMELISGESLEERLARGGPLAPPEAARLTGKLARALAHAHDQGVLHRDLKPANVLLQAADDEPRLTDFGVAWILDPDLESLSRSGQLVGTPGFFAPEQATGAKAEIGPHTDIYGLGALLYAALTGEAPIKGETLPEVLIATVNRSVAAPSTLNSAVDPRLDAICLQCLEKEPSKRYSSAVALAEDLTHYLRGELVSARVRRGWRRWWIAVGALALVALGLAAWTVIGRAPQTAGSSGQNVPTEHEAQSERPSRATREPAARAPAPRAPEWIRWAGELRHCAQICSGAHPAGGVWLESATALTWCTSGGVATWHIGDEGVSFRESYTLPRSQPGSLTYAAWDARSGLLVLLTPGLVLGVPREELPSLRLARRLQPLREGALAFAHAPASGVAAWRDERGGLRWVDLTQREVHTLAQKEVRVVLDGSGLNSRVQLALSPDGRLLATLEGRTVQTWRLPDGELLAERDKLVVSEDPGWYVANASLAVVESAGVKRVLIGLEDGRIETLSPDLAPLGELSDPSAPVAAQAFQQAPTPQAPCLLAGSPPLLVSLATRPDRDEWNSTLRVWSLENPHCLLRSMRAERCFRIAPHPSASRLLVGTTRGRVLLVELGSGSRTR